VKAPLLVVLIDKSAKVLEKLEQCLIQQFHVFLCHQEKFTEAFADPNDSVTSSSPGANNVVRPARQKHRASSNEPASSASVLAGGGQRLPPGTARRRTR